MDELELTLGQRTVPAVRGEQTTATSYAGLGSRHVLMMADGAAGPIPSRLAAQVAASSAMARFRGSLFPVTEEQLKEAFIEAHGAVRRGAIGTHAEDRAGAALIAVVIEAAGVTAARIGGGRAYIIIGEAIYPLFRQPGEGFVGDDSTEAEISAWPEPLPQNARVVVMTESTARAVAADIDQLGGRAPPQLAAGRLVDAARRRGQYEPLAAQVALVQSASERPAVHPAVERLGRESTRTLTTDGRWIGTADNARSRSRRAKTEAGWVMWFFLAILCGAGLALILHDTPPAEPEPDLTISSQLGDTLPMVADAQSDTTTQAPRPDVPRLVVPEPRPYMPNEAEIAALFDRPNPRSAARALQVYIRNRFAKDGSLIFEELEDWILENNSPHVVATLLELTKKGKLKRTQRWIRDLLPRLYARQ